MPIDLTFFLLGNVFRYDPIPCIINLTGSIIKQAEGQSHQIEKSFTKYCFPICFCYFENAHRVSNRKCSAIISISILLILRFSFTKLPWLQDNEKRKLRIEYQFSQSLV